MLDALDLCFSFVTVGANAKLASEGLVPCGLARQMSAEGIGIFLGIRSLLTFVALVVCYDQVVKRVGVAFTCTVGLLIAAIGALIALPQVFGALPACSSSRLCLREASLFDSRASAAREISQRR